MQKKASRARLEVRSAVEGVIAHEKSIFGLLVRTTGIARAETMIGPANRTGNAKRYFWITAKKQATA